MELKNQLSESQYDLLQQFFPELPKLKFNEGSVMTLLYSYKLQDIIRNAVQDFSTKH